MGKIFCVDVDLYAINTIFGEVDFCVGGRLLIELHNENTGTCTL